MPQKNDSRKQKYNRIWYYTLGKFSLILLELLQYPRIKQMRFLQVQVTVTIRLTHQLITHHLFYLYTSTEGYTKVIRGRGFSILFLKQACARYAYNDMGPVKTQIQSACLVQQNNEICGRHFAPIFGGVQNLFRGVKLYGGKKIHCSAKGKFVCKFISRLSALLVLNIWQCLTELFITL